MCSTHLEALPAVCPQWLMDIANTSDFSDKARAWIHLEPRHGGLGLDTTDNFVNTVTIEREWTKKDEEGSSHPQQDAA